MAISTYHFITNWRVEATCQEIYTILMKLELRRRKGEPNVPPPPPPTFPHNFLNNNIL